MGVPRKVLLVDDEPDNLHLWETALKPLAVPCDRATNGHAAFAQVVAERHAVVVLDLLMPHWDGLTTLQALRIAAPETRVIVVSAYIDDHTERQLEEAPNVVGWYRKPPNLKDLRERVRAALEKAAAE